MCSCGLYAIGQCKQCGAARCGECGTRTGGQFVCRSHAEEERLAEDEERERAERAHGELIAAVHRAVWDEGGITPRDHTGAEIAAALSRILPGDMQSFQLRRVVDTKKVGLLRRKTEDILALETVHGWAFEVDAKTKTDMRSEETSVYGEILVILDDGSLHRSIRFLRSSFGVVDGTYHGRAGQAEVKGELLPREARPVSKSHVERIVESIARTRVPEIPPDP